MSLSLSTKFSGEFRLVVKKPDGRVSYESDWFPNLILNSGLNRLSITSQGHICSYAHIGTGTSVPVETQTALDAFVASGSYVSGPSVINSGSPNYITTYTFSFSFAQGAVVGNMAEVGIGWSNVTGSLWSRALILDPAGQPTTITLTAIDQLTVYYRLNVVPTLTDATSTVVISGTTYGYTSRVATAGTFANGTWNFNGPQAGHVGSIITANPNVATYGAGAILGSITGNPSGGGTSTSGGASVGFGSYTPDSFARDDTFSWPINQGNSTGGIQVIVLAYGYGAAGRFQYRFDTVIPKSNTNVLTISARITWGRA